MNAMPFSAKKHCDGNAASRVDPIGKEDNVEFAGDRFVHGLGTVLATWARESAAADRPVQLSCYHSAQLPSISIQDYISRLRKLFVCSEECFVIALVYIDRVIKNTTSVTVCDVTVHRLLVIAVMTAVKFHDDHFYSNKYYAKAGGLTLRETNRLEVLMLNDLNWKMLVTTQEYKLYHDLACKAFDLQA